MTPVVEAARLYKSRGWSPVPVISGKKRPFLTEWQNFEVSEDDIPNVFNGHEVGVILGERSKNIYDLDLDELLTIRISSHFLPKTPTIFGHRSKPESHHIYQGLDTDIISRTIFKTHTGELLAEVRGSGNQTLFPPSTHVSGEPIEWKDPHNTQPATVPLETTLHALGWACSATLLVKHWGEWSGKHHDLIGALAGGMLRAGVPVQTCEDFVRVVMLYAGDHEPHDRLSMIHSTAERLTEDPEATVTGFPTLRSLIGNDVVKLLLDWLRLPKPESTGTTRTDDGNARLYVEAFEQALRYCPQTGLWLSWTGARWLEDETGFAIALAREVPDIIYKLASKELDEDEHQKIVKWSLASRSYAHITAIPKLAQTDERIQVHNEALNVDPFAFNVQNGTINLRTGGLSPHNPDDLITHISPVIFDPRATCPRWEAALDLLFSGDQELIDFIQKSVGYSLTASTKEQCFYLLLGNRGTGKSTFIDPLIKMLGSYTVNAAPATFTVKINNSRATPDVARLQYARMVTTSESEAGDRLSAALLKRLTGSSRITASYLYQNEFEYAPKMKIWVDTNYKPKVSSTDGALWDRLIAIPFEVLIRGTPTDVKGYSDYLLLELPGILNWAIDGCQKWLSDGLRRPESVRIFGDEYRTEQDPLRAFIDECCILTPDARVGVRELFSVYQNWCERSNEKAWRFRTFNTGIEERGFPKHETNRGMEWRGLKAYGHAPTMDGFTENPFDRPVA